MKTVVVYCMVLAMGYCTETTVNETAVNGTQWPKKDDIVTTLSVSLGENITLEEAQVHVTKLWTRYFFDMPRRPRNGSVTFVFPGLFSDNALDNRTKRADELKSRMSRSQPADFRPDADEPSVNTTADTSRNEQIQEAQPLNTPSQFTYISNDSRWYEHNMTMYHFEDIESIDEEARQRRRLRSARREINLLDADQLHITTMINSVFSSTRDFVSNQSIRSSVVRYLTTKMRSLGLVTGNQIFDPQEFYDVFEGHIPNGTNVVGILPGQHWGTKDDEILVLGAHWDTFPSSSGMDDNGSGVTALLEVARALTEASCRSKHSIIFVAFDLEEVGCLGSMYFVRDFLVPHVLKAHGGARLKGAFILDTIMNFNESQYSQTLSDEWKNAVPDLLTDLTADNFTGNFLTVLYRRDVDSILANTLADNWNDDGAQQMKTLSAEPHRIKTRGRRHQSIRTNSANTVTTVKTKEKFDLKNVRLDLEAEVEEIEKLATWVDLLRSDHSRFWYHNVDYPTSLPAVLITDTGPYRGMMQQCYHQVCDSSEANRQLKFANVKFLTKTCQALIDTLVTLSQSQCLADDVLKPIESESTSHSHGHRIAPVLANFLVVFLTILHWIGVL